MIDSNELGPLLKKKRREKNITQTQIGDYVGLSKNHISDMERGVHKISVQAFCGYCDMLGITPNELLDIHSGDNIIPELKNILDNMEPEKQEKLIAIAKVL